MKMSIKDYFKPIGVDKSIVIASSNAANPNPREELEAVKSIEAREELEDMKSVEEGVQKGGGGVSKWK